MAALVKLVWMLVTLLAAGAEGLSLGRGGDIGIGRRDVLGSAATAGAAIVLGGEGDAASAADRGPIAVVGASGRTGALCVASCLRRGIPVRALTRSGEWQYPEDDGSTLDASKLLSVQACDAKDPSALTSATEGSSAVIYAASASKKGGKAKEIDNEAVVSAARSCVANNVPRYVLISSTAVTRPKSLGYKFTNVYQNIMGEKRLGELGVMTVYGEAKKGPSYTIIRPGGLEEPKKNEVLGPSALEVSQGDVFAGIVSRADLAEVAVEAALSRSSNLGNTSFELYYTYSVQPCEGRFKPLLESGEVKRSHGDSYSSLFEGLRPDGKYFVP